MTVNDLIEFLQDVNPTAPVFIDCHGLIIEVDSIESQNGRVCIQGY